MTAINSALPVLVTGANGYIASWIIKYLLERGHTVHATVRDPAKHSSVAHLLDIAKNTKGSLTLFKADLLDDGAFDDAMQGCELVMHTASPFVVTGLNDPYQDLVRPALEGTKNVLGSVQRTLSVKRVVLTSSMAATFGDTVDLLNVPDQTATEKMWNSSSSLTHQPYSYSKTVAEQVAWEINSGQARWDLVCINPVMVMGPALTKNSVSGSIETLKQFGNGTMRTGAPPMSFAIVDVRDVAQAHILAGYTPSAQGRYLVSAASLDFLGISKVLREKYSLRYPLPITPVPKFLFWLVAPILGYQRKFVKNNAGYPMKVNASKSTRELGIEYRGLRETLHEHFQQLIDDGLIKNHG